MKKISKLPTILGLVILTIGLVAGVFLINSKTIFKIGAQTGTNPKNVRVTNITSDSITITWTTDKKTSGFVKWGNSKSSTSKIANDSIENGSNTHSATILGLNPNENIFFKINSNGEDWDNEGISWQTKTLSQITNGETMNISGTVVLPNGNPAKNTLVYVSASGSMFSAVTSTDGNWFIPLSKYISIDPETTVLEISVDSVINGSSTAIIYPKAAKNTPVIVLGKSYDFRTLDSSSSGDLPESEVSIPDQVETSSRFEIETDSSEETQSTTVTLESIDQNEIITTTDPEFFGNAPSGIEIEIVVESETQSTSLVTKNGSWSWSPPESLEQGEHSVTIKWIDESGITKIIKRTFLVSASEGPAFESTPSATPTLISTSTPTSMPTIIATPTASSSSTPKPLPETGGLTPTLGLFIMGVGILMSSFYVWRTANA